MTMTKSMAKNLYAVTVTSSISPLAHIAHIENGDGNT